MNRAASLLREFAAGIWLPERVTEPVLGVIETPYIKSNRQVVSGIFIEGRWQEDLLYPVTDECARGVSGSVSGNKAPGSRVGAGSVLPAIVWR